MPGNAVPKKQLHIFDFDDTLGKTKNPNGVMLYKNGNPAHTTDDDAVSWFKSYGILPNNFLEGPPDGKASPKYGKKVQYFDNLKGWAVYIDSEALAKLTGSPEFQNKKFTATKQDIPPANIDQALYIDFSPSKHVDLKTTEPITHAIDKLKSAEKNGADTWVLTARAPHGKIKNFAGEDVPITNAKDIENFLKGRPDEVDGVTGKNKGEAILSKLKKKALVSSFKDFPEEIHFYDDAANNVKDVEKELKGLDTEVYIYGPGDFHKNPNLIKQPKPATFGKIYTRKFRA
jgi:hypothetical protein